MAQRIRRDLLAVVSVLVAYYAAPVGELSSSVPAVVFSVVGLLVGLVVIVWLIIRQARALLHSKPDDPTARVDGLVMLLSVVVPLFSLSYFALESAEPSQFADLQTKTDALYFTVSTLGTVGFGDIHAAGQLARVMVMVQMVFDLIFVAAVVSVITAHIRRRASAVARGDAPSLIPSSEATSQGGAEAEAADN